MYRIKTSLILSKRYLQIYLIISIQRVNAKNIKNSEKLSFLFFLQLLCDMIYLRLNARISKLLNKLVLAHYNAPYVR